MSQGEQPGQGLVLDERARSWEMKNGALGDEGRKQGWRTGEQVEEELAEEQRDLLGLGGQPLVQMQGEREVKEGGEWKEVGWRGTVGQEGWEVELRGRGLGSGGVVDQGELGEGCHRVTPH